MYTLEQLRQKTFKQLKEIGWEFNLLPAGDRRCRQNWIDAIVGVQPPLLQLLEVSPGVEVEPVEELIEDYLDINELRQLDHADCPACGGIDSLDARWSREYAHGFWIIYCEKCDSTCSCSIEELPTCLRGEDDKDDDEDEDIEFQVTKLIAPDPETSPEADRDEAAPAIEIQRQESIEYGRITGYLCRPKSIAQAAVLNDEQPPSRGDSGRNRLESAIAPADKNPPGVDHKTSTAHQLLERLKSWVHVIDCPTLSDSFQARYSPPQSHNIHYQADTDGQLNLFDFEVEPADEPPDPDDFDSLDAFREALARWDAENPESLTVSIDSMREWAPCPHDWYEPTAENLPLEAPSMEVMELSPVIETIEIIESSSTCEFLIPVFGLGDRTSDTDEPPDMGIFARLPKPKPPSFPPRGVVAGDRANRIKKFARSAILLSWRSPPGGDASF